MVAMKNNCNFCGLPLRQGTGTLYVKRDGTVLTFCCRKCEMNMTLLKRDPKKIKWTSIYRKAHSKKA